MGQGAGSGSARERLVLLVLAAVQFTNIVDFMIVMPLGPQLMRTLGIDSFRFGLIVSSYTFSASAAGLGAAWLVDRFDRRSAFLSLYTGFLLGTLCCAIAPGYLSLLAARVVTGAFGGVLGGMTMAIIGDVFPEHRRGTATGILMGSFSLASVAGVPLGLLLGNEFGWHAPFLMLVGLGLPVLAAGLRALPSIRGHLEHAKGGPASRLDELKTTLTRPEHVRAFALIVTLMLGGFAVVPFISNFLVKNVGVPEKRLFVVYVVGGVFTLVSSPLIGRLADRFGKYPVYRVVAVVSAAFMLGITALPPVPLALAALAVGAVMVGNSGRMVVAMTMVTSCVEPRRRGSFMSLNSSMQHLAAGLGSFLGGVIIGESTGGRMTRFPVVGLIAAASTLASVALAAGLTPYAGANAKPAPETIDPELGVDPAPAAALEMPPAAEVA